MVWGLFLLVPADRRRRNQPQVKPPLEQEGGAIGPVDEDEVPMDGAETCFGDGLPQVGQGAS